MASYNTSEFKSGLKILIDGDPFVIVENERVCPTGLSHSPFVQH